MRMSDRLVGELMQRDVVSVAPDTGLDSADAIMKKTGIRHLVVLDGRKVVGILSDRDMLHASLSGALEFDVSMRRIFLNSVDVENVMSKDVTVSTTDTTLGQAAALMLEHRISCLPIVGRDGNLVGIVSESDLLRLAFLDPDSEGAGSEAALAEWLDRQLDELRQTRDEIRVQLSLGKAEVRERWEALEQRTGKLEQEARRVAESTVASLVDELRESYRRLRDES